MIFAVIGLFKPSPEPQQDSFVRALNEHLAQPFQKLISAGFLHDDGGRKIGVLALLEAKDIQKARAYVDTGPFKQHDLYAHLTVAEYAGEVGRLG